MVSNRFNCYPAVLMGLPLITACVTASTRRLASGVMVGHRPARAVGDKIRKIRMPEN